MREGVLHAFWLESGSQNDSNFGKACCIWRCRWFVWRGRGHQQINICLRNLPSASSTKSQPRSSHREQNRFKRRLLNSTRSSYESGLAENTWKPVCLFHSGQKCNTTIFFFLLFLLFDPILAKHSVTIVLIQIQAWIQIIKGGFAQVTGLLKQVLDSQQKQFAIQQQCWFC